MLRLSTLGVRFATVGLSGAVHAAVLLSWTGHAPSAVASTTEATIEVQLDPTTTPDMTLPDPVAKAEDRAPHWPQHTHPYPVAPDHDAVPHDPRLVHLPFPHPEGKPLPSAEQAAPAETASDDMPRFTIAVGSGSPGAYGAVSPAGTAPAAHAEAAGPVDERSVDAPARLVQGVFPAYPEDARAAHLEADVGLELLVSPSGHVESARVVRPAGHGFDQPAIDAVQRFHFAPAMKDGHPVEVRMAWTMHFRLS